MGGGFGHVDGGGHGARGQGLAGAGLQAQLARDGAGDALAVAVRQRLREHHCGRVDIRGHPGHAAAAGRGAGAQHLQPAAGDVDVDVLAAFRRFGEGIQGRKWRRRGNR